MTLHRIPRADLEVALVQIVRGGEHIDALYEDADGWVVVTEDRIEVRPALRALIDDYRPSPARQAEIDSWTAWCITHADRLGVQP